MNIFKKRKKASITLEACIVVPISLLFALTLFLYAETFVRSANAQNALNSTAEQIMNSSTITNTDTDYIEGYLNYTSYYRIYSVSDDAHVDTGIIDYICNTDELSAVKRLMSEPENAFYSTVLCLRSSLDQDRTKTVFGAVSKAYFFSFLGFEPDDIDDNVFEKYDLDDSNVDIGNGKCYLKCSFNISPFWGSDLFGSIRFEQRSIAYIWN